MIGKRLHTMAFFVLKSDEIRMLPLIHHEKRRSKFQVNSIVHPLEAKASSFAKYPYHMYIQTLSGVKERIAVSSKHFDLV